MIKDYRGYRVEITSESDNGRWEAVARGQPSDAGNANLLVISLLTLGYETAEAAEAAMWEDTKRKIDEILAA